MRKEERDFYLNLGICPICRKYAIFGEEKSCPECKVKQSEEKAIYRSENREEYNENMRTYHNSRYQELRAKGLCTRCGKRKTNSSMCGICANKMYTARAKRKQNKIPQSERYLHGLCHWCDNPIKKGYKVCEKHYQMNCEKGKLSDKTNARILFGRKAI